MIVDHTVQFGHSDSERLQLANFDVDPDTYTADADIRAGNFKGAARIYGRVDELMELQGSLQRMSKSLSGEVEFKNMEGQLVLRCSISNLGTVYIHASITDYDNRTECSFTTDPASLDVTIAALATVTKNARGES